MKLRVKKGKGKPNDKKTQLNSNSQVSFSEKVRESQIWWEKHENESSLLRDLKKCLNSKFAFQDIKIPLLIRRIIHFDAETRNWMENPKQNSFFCLKLSTMNWEELSKNEIPIVLQHTLNNPYRELFQKASDICFQDVKNK